MQIILFGRIMLNPALQKAIEPKTAVVKCFHRNMNLFFFILGPRPRRMSTASSYRSAIEKPNKNKWSSANSLYTPLASLVDIPEVIDKSPYPKSEKNINSNGTLLHKQDEAVYNPNMSIKKKEKSRMKRILLAVIHFFDLTLLKDPIYVNIMLGMSFAVFAELNFSLLTPFMLADLSLTTSEIATFLSVLSIADLCFRFFAPFIGDYLKKPPRIMYSISLLLLIGTRYSKYEGFHSVFFLYKSLSIENLLSIL